MNKNTRLAISKLDEDSVSDNEGVINNSTAKLNRQNRKKNILASSSDSEEHHSHHQDKEEGKAHKTNLNKRRSLGRTSTAMSKTNSEDNPNTSSDSRKKSTIVKKIKLVAKGLDDIHDSGISSVDRKKSVNGYGIPQESHTQPGGVMADRTAKNKRKSSDGGDKSGNQRNRDAYLDFSNDEASDLTNESLVEEYSDDGYSDGDKTKKSKRNKNGNNNGSGGVSTKRRSRNYSDTHLDQEMNKRDIKEGSPTADGEGMEEAEPSGMTTRETRRTRRRKSSATDSSVNIGKKTTTKSTQPITQEEDQEIETPQENDLEDADMGSDADSLESLSDDALEAFYMGVGAEASKVDESKLTRRQRARLTNNYDEELVELTTESKKVEYSTEELALRKSEFSRRRKFQSLQRAEQLKNDTISRLLNKQSSKGRNKVVDDNDSANTPGSATSATPSGGYPGLGDNGGNLVSATDPCVLPPGKIRWSSYSVVGKDNTKSTKYTLRLPSDLSLSDIFPGKGGGTGASEVSALPSNTESSPVDHQKKTTSSVKCGVQGGRSFESVATIPIRFTTCIPSHTLPNIVCLPSNQGVGARVMKNYKH
ncbi:hypothetical protein AX774_g3447 [Zancudomyces culisetae]|uniref:INO80 complex subunit B-like conserved region domain-containing protein n=1 Tax=Zancudomyces culisetae TaxID=1213189 RepID=A0A1R1PPY0_ZANCU|nr:hypothetical protein AX774_g3447 [Zancudomyces culisetae]|eukprot:OMH83046.1 hypothetical protein AX774_g3447 [Zancudomyces culisetae]